MKYEVIWVIEGVAVIEADSAAEAQEAFFGDIDFYTSVTDSITVEAIPSPIEN